MNIDLSCCIFTGQHLPVYCSKSAWQRCR